MFVLLPIVVSSILIYCDLQFMKISFITLFTPTSENRMGPSALNYYLMRDREADIHISVFSFNINRILPDEISVIERELKVKIYLIPLPRWYRFITSPHHKMTFIRAFLCLPLFAYIRIGEKMGKRIKAERPDVVWWYPSELFNIPRSLVGYKHVVTGPDCASLTPFRILQVPSIYKKRWNFIGHFKLLVSSLRMERGYQTYNTLMHVVGMCDAYKLCEISPDLNVIFLLHPHYALSSKVTVDFNKRKLNLLLAGTRSQLNEDETVAFVEALCKQSKELIPYYNITFLGKGWEKEVSKLKLVGYDCNELKWVDNYIEAIAQYDIQVTLLSAGAGTKGKVLDALANGLLVIGSEIALENIAVRHNDSCLRYRHIDEIVTVLRAIPLQKNRYEEIARKGMAQVRTYHAPQRISKRFFDIVELFFAEKNNVLHMPSEWGESGKV